MEKRKEVRYTAKPHGKKFSVETTGLFHTRAGEQISDNFIAQAVGCTRTFTPSDQNDAYKGQYD